MRRRAGYHVPHFARSGNRPMRLMVVSHSYMEPVPRQKWMALRDVDSDIEILVVTPCRWPDSEMWFNVSEPYADGRVKFAPVTALLGGWVSRHFYCSPRLIALLRQFKPDIIQVEAEPWSAVYGEMALLRRLLVPQAKLVFFTWWNTPRRVPFPFNISHRLCLSATDLVIAGNHGALEILKSHGYSGRVEVVPQLGVDDSLYQPRPKDPVLVRKNGLGDAFVVGYVGRLIKRKGIDLLLDALAGMQETDWRLLVIGAGPERPALEKRAAALGISRRVVFTGAIERSAIPDYLNCMDVLVLPSRREQWEQFGHVLIEAMACGVPVVGSNSGEIPHVVGEAGFVFPMEDSVALAAYLWRLAADANLAARCRQAGRQRVRDEYNHAAVARRLARIYRELVASRLEMAHV